MKTIAESELHEIRKGKMEPLSMLFRENYEYCVKQLCIQTNCMPEDAEDLIMDALIVLREKIMLDEYVNENLQGYILTLAKNMWRNKVKHDRKRLVLEPKIVESYLSKQAKESGLSEENQKRVDVVFKALRQLGGNCEILIRKNLIDRVPLRNLSEELGYKSEDVAKTTKARCMKKLKILIHELMNS